MNRAGFVLCGFALMALAMPALADPVAHWTLDENPPGASMIDSTGNGHDAAVGGAPLSVPAVAGRGLELDGGSDEHLSVSDSAELHLPDFTLSAWVKYTSLGNEGHIVGKHVPNSFNGYFLSVYDNRLCLFFNSDAARVVSPLPYDDGRWHHVAATYDSVSGMASLYVDGDLKNSLTASRCADNNTGMTIGGVGYGYANFQGQLDDVQIYGTALSSTQVVFLHDNPGKVVPEPTTLALLTLGGLALIRRRRTA